jgi:tetratricopeptide (TPR) repeat protein
MKPLVYCETGCLRQGEESFSFGPLVLAESHSELGSVYGAGVGMEVGAGDLSPEFRLEFAKKALELLLLEERWDEAAIWGEVLHDIDPDDPDYLLHYSAALYGLGRIDRAIGVLESRTEEFRDDPCFHFRLALYYAASRDHGTAHYHLNYAVAMDHHLREAAGIEPLLEPLLDGLPLDSRAAESRGENRPF